ncbi:Long-chain base-1-phosphate phosphatase [Marasmius tenuissimus]|uniref:Long-chain base-1-phosphate phosphatase n=1 Tax=Marasmius tenuissimus TaxID=585030 RepID=A0ABR2ZJ79_9AGAR
MQTGRSNGRVTFDLTTEYSEPPTREASPSPSEKQGLLDEKAPLYPGIDFSPGKQPSDIYEQTLPWWRAAIRRQIVKRVEVESKTVARLQVSTFKINSTLKLMEVILHEERTAKSVPRQLFRLYIVFGDPHILYGHVACHVLLWVPRNGTWVSLVELF